MNCALAHLGGCSGWLDPHHVLRQSFIKARFRHGGVWVGNRLEPLGRTALVEPEVTLRELLDDRRNLVAVCRTHHERLENRRLYLDPPGSAVEFAVELGLGSVFERARERAA